MKNLRTGLLVVFIVILCACQPHAMSRGVGQNIIEHSDLLGVWVVEFIAERPVIDRSPARIQFSADGDINGNASCNRFFGNYTYNDQLLVINQLGSTRMMCLPALMEQEVRLLEFLPTASSASIENGLLILRDTEGKLVIQASKEELSENGI